MSEAYLRNYFPFEIGAKLYYYSNINGVDDTLCFTVTDKSLSQEFTPWSDIISKENNTEKNSSEDDENEFGDKDKFEHLIYACRLESDTVSFSFYFDILTSVSIIDTSIYSGYYFGYYTPTQISGATQNCVCSTKETVLYCCFSSKIQLYKKAVLYAEIVNGKGIVKFIDNRGNYWRFIDYKE
ncbi:MAG: hypothetical protein ACI3ZZ_06660 [Candidatus Aphodosoma sp.]